MIRLEAVIHLDPRWEKEIRGNLPARVISSTTGLEKAIAQVSGRYPVGVAESDVGASRSGTDGLGS